MRGSGGRSRPPVGSRGKAPGRGLGATFFQYVITKNSILEHENQIFASQQALCLDQTFTWLFSKLH